MEPSNFLNGFKVIECENYRLIYHINSSQLLKINKESALYNYFSLMNSSDNSIHDNNYKEITKKLKHKFDTEDKPIASIFDENCIDFQTVVLPISGNCNLACSYCFAQTKNGFGFNDFNIEQGRKIVDFIMSNNNIEETCVISFFGGEPFLRPDIMEDIVEYTKLNYSNRSVRFSVTTNGTIINDSTVKLLITHNIDCLVSLDGPENWSHNRIFKNGKASYGIVRENIEKLIKSGVSISLRATIPSDTENIVEIYDFLESLELPFAAVRAYQSVNQTNLANYDDRQESFKKQYKDLMNYYSDRAKSGKRINCHSILSDLQAIKKQRVKRTGCVAGYKIFSITDEGDIFTCEHLAYDKSLSVGNIIHGVDKNKIQSTRPPRVDILQNCKECWVVNLCAGGCFTQKMTISDQKSADAECDIIKIYWEFILLLYYNLKELNYLYEPITEQK